MSNAVTFDTHAFVKKLEAVGFTEQQAEVFAESQAKIIDERLVTKEHFDLTMKELDNKFKELEMRLTIRLGWLMVIAIGVVATLVKIL